MIDSRKRLVKRFQNTILFVGGFAMVISPFVIGDDAILFVRWLNNFPIFNRYPMEYWAMHASVMVVCVGVGIMFGAILLAWDRRRSHM